MTGTIEVTGTNNVPRATVYYFGAQENSIVSGAFESSDVDGDSVTYELLEGPSTGTLTLNEDGSYLYDAGAYQNYTAEGNVTQINFTYRIKDSYGGYTDQRGFVVYEGTNDTPIIYNADIMRSGSEEAVLMENTSSHDIYEADRYQQLHELSNGSFLLVYSDGYGEPYAEVRFKIVSATGEIIAPDQRVDTNDVDWQRSPDTLVMSDGSFWVYWSLDRETTQADSYFGRHYDVNGTALGGEVEFASRIRNAFSANAVETASGNILFTWVNSDDEVNLEVKTQLFDSSFNSLSPAQVTFNGFAREVKSFALEDGSVLNTWHNNEQNFFQHIDANGLPTGEAQIFAPQFYDDVVMLEDGNLLGIWAERIPGFSSQPENTFIEKRSIAGDLIEGPLLINSGFQVNFPKLTADASGGFVVTFDAINGGNEGWAQIFDADLQEKPIFFA